MKRGLIVLGFALFFIGFASASIDIHNSTFKTVYFPYEEISGEVNLTMEDVDFLSYVTTSNGGHVRLEDFFTDNGADYNCDPSDCTNNYDSSGSSTDKLFSMETNEPAYVGFVLQGSDVEITGIHFNITSDFQESIKRPLSIKFFEDVEWGFGEFSDTFGARSFGCYDAIVPIQGPLLRTSTYCEAIPLYETGSVFAGALVDSSDTTDLRMSIYDSSGGSSLGECEFNPGSEEGCRIDAEEGGIFSAGTYYVCVEGVDPTNYHIYEDPEGEEDSCGFVYSEGIESSSKDYGIFASSAKYADYSSFDSSEFDFENLAIQADSLIETRYGRDCTNKCILPLELVGQAQDFRIYNVAIDYIEQGEDNVDNKVYSLTMTPATVDFSGVLDLGLSGFNASKSGEYTISIGDGKIINEDIEVLPAPIIKSISPVAPPAGVPFLFFVLTEKYNGSLNYKWDFGDGVTEETTVPFVEHSYKEIKNYTLKIEASAGNLTSKKEFYVSTVSPKDSINSSIASRKEAISDLASQINTYPLWYQERLRSLVNLSYYQTELDGLSRARDNANYDADYLKIATDLYSMDLPISIYVSDHQESPLVNEAKDIDPSIISDFAGGGSEQDFEAYKKAILKWQTDNLEATVRTDLISVIRFSGIEEPIVRAYSVSFTSHSDDSESYAVINRPLSDLYFKEDPGARKLGESTVVILDGVERKSFDFYYFRDTEEASFFASPKLTSLILEENIDMTCNRNGVCEKENGETADNCREDCKPTVRMVLYIILVIIFGGFLYSVVQYWYKRRYESYLFKDRRELYNVTMYIINARARGLSDNQIERDLKKQGWASEKVDYAIHKSWGKTVGMPEIIPVTKIKAYLRARRARMSVTSSKQQSGRNINKYSSPKNVI